MSVRIVHRPARTVRAVVPPEPLTLAAPPLLPDKKTGGPALQSFLPMIGAVSSMTMMITMRNNPLLVGVGALVMAAALAAGLASLLGSRAQGNRQRRLHRERYLDYLEELSGQMLDAEIQARATARTVDPEPGALIGIIGDPARLWDRRRADSDFLTVRLGTGTVGWRELSVPDNGTPTQPSDEFMLAEARALAARYGATPGLPLTAALDQAGDVAVIGSPTGVANLVRTLIAQAAVFHAPDDLAIAAAIPTDSAAEWDWLAWLPHVSDEALRDGPTATHRIAPDLTQLARLMAAELAARATFAAESRRGLASTNTARLAQRLLVLSDSRGRTAERLALPDATLDPGEAGITVIHLVTDRLQEPSDISRRITVDDDGLVTVEDLTDPDRPLTATGGMDEVGTGTILGLARALAPLRLSRATLAEQVQIGAVDTATLLGIDDATSVDVSQLWSPRPRLDFLRVPIGVDDTGNPILLDLKESAQLGMGPHGLCVGATGSGKSELLRTLVTTLAVTHPPDQVAMVLVDYKGGAAFAPFAGLPHVAGIIDNLADEPGLVERAHASLNGEVVRRQRVLKDAGNLAGVDQYNEVRTQHPERGLPPLPHLLIIIDEFGELIAARDDFIELFLTIGRIGRSIGVHLLLSSQRIESGRLKGLDTYLSYRLGLRTFSEGESQIVLDTPDAFRLPSLPGYGYLKVDTSIYSRFRGAYVSGPASPTLALTASGTEPDGTPLVRPRGFYPRLLSNESDTASAEPPEPTITRTLLDALLTQVTVAHGRPTRTVWLPPLPQQLTLDQAVEVTIDDTTGGPSIEPVGGPMRVPMGLLDNPGQQLQHPWLLDLTTAGGHAAVIGGPQSGKTTLLRTLVAGLCLSHTPDQVAVYGLDLAGNGLAPLRQLPHVGEIAVRTDPERLGRTLDELLGMLAHREAVFRDHGIDSVDDLRRRRRDGIDDGLPSDDLVLVIDGAGAIRTDFDQLEDRFADLLRRGPGFGVHLVLGLSRWNDLPIALQPAVGTRLELRLNDPGDSVIDRKLAATLPGSPRGRVLTDQRLIAQAALPRIDSATDDATSNPALTDLGRAVDAGWRGRRAPAVRVLPTVVMPDGMPDPIDEPGIPIGVAESTLEPVALDLFGADPHLVALGDSDCGKSTLIRTIARGLTERYTSEEIVLAVYDPSRSLTAIADDDYVGGYAGNSSLAGRLSATIAQQLSTRMPDNVIDPNSSTTRSWTGPAIVLLIDDYDKIIAARPDAFDPFAPYLPYADDIGLHIVLTGPVAGSSRFAYLPFFTSVEDNRATRLLMNGDRTAGQLFGVYPRPLPVGRGQLLRRGRPADLVQLAELPEPTKP